MKINNMIKMHMATKPAMMKTKTPMVKIMTKTTIKATMTKTMINKTTISKITTKMKELEEASGDE